MNNVLCLVISHSQILLVLCFQSPKKYCAATTGHLQNTVCILMQTTVTYFNPCKCVMEWPDTNTAIVPKSKEINWML